MLKDKKTAHKYLLRRQLFAETGAVFFSTLVFSKLVLFTHYPVLNIPIKLLLLYSYTALLDPLVVYAGYRVTRFIEDSQ